MTLTAKDWDVYFHMINHYRKIKQAKSCIDNKIIVKGTAIGKTTTRSGSSLISSPVASIDNGNNSNHHQFHYNFIHVPNHSQGLKKHDCINCATRKSLHVTTTVRSASVPPMAITIPAGSKSARRTIKSRAQSAGSSFRPGRKTIQPRNNPNNVKLSIHVKQLNNNGSQILSSDSIKGSEVINNNNNSIIRQEKSIKSGPTVSKTISQDQPEQSRLKQDDVISGSLTATTVPPLLGKISSDLLVEVSSSDHEISSTSNNNNRWQNKDFNNKLEEHEYILFLLGITEDIIRNGVYTLEKINRIVSSHMNANKNRLDPIKMQRDVDRLMEQLSIVAPEIITKSEIIVADDDVKQSLLINESNDSNISIIGTVSTNECLLNQDNQLLPSISSEALTEITEPRSRSHETVLGLELIHQQNSNSTISFGQIMMEILPGFEQLEHGSNACLNEYQDPEKLLLLNSCYKEPDFCNFQIIEPSSIHSNSNNKESTTHQIIKDYQTLLGTNAIKIELNNDGGSNNQDEYILVQGLVCVKKSIFENKTVPVVIKTIEPTQQKNVYKVHIDHLSQQEEEEEHEDVLLVDDKPSLMSESIIGNILDDILLSSDGNLMEDGCQSPSCHSSDLLLQQLSNEAKLSNDPKQICALIHGNPLIVPSADCTSMSASSSKSLSNNYQENESTPELLEQIDDEISLQHKLVNSNYECDLKPERDENTYVIAKRTESQTDNDDDNNNLLLLNEDYRLLPPDEFCPVDDETQTDDKLLLSKATTTNDDDDDDNNNSRIESIQLLRLNRINDDMLLLDDKVPTTTVELATKVTVVDKGSSRIRKASATKTDRIVDNHRRINKSQQFRTETFATSHRFTTSSVVCSGLMTTKKKPQILICDDDNTDDDNCSTITTLNFADANNYCNYNVDDNDSD